MKVKELGKLTGLNIETIRMYRKLGFLHPTKLANGYYDYSMQDFASLSQIRKYREFDFSLEEIELVQHEYDTERLLKKYASVEERLKREIKIIEEKINFIHFEKNHILSSKDTESMKATVNQSVDEKIDIYPPFQKQAPLLPENTPGNFLYTTTPIFISKEILNGPIQDKVISTKIGIGTYRSIVDRFQLVIPDNAIYIPNGLCISQTVAMEDLMHINIKELAPMMNYAKKLKTKFISDTTGYLVSIHYHNNKPLYFMRIRACIEKNETISPDRL